MKVTCKRCKHSWNTESKLMNVLCASCNTRNKNPNYKSKLKGSENGK